MEKVENLAIAVQNRSTLYWIGKKKDIKEKQ
jgi:hypothetical protein